MELSELFSRSRRSLRPIAIMFSTIVGTLIVEIASGLITRVCLIIFERRAWDIVPGALARSFTVRVTLCCCVLVECSQINLPWGKWETCLRRRHTYVRNGIIYLYCAIACISTRPIKTTTRQITAFALARITYLNNVEMYIHTYTYVRVGKSKSSLVCAYR